eukprot:gnl/Dysnectes_brevis/2110_a2448_1266.p1 GENE.gnl/Dysnectes_brevis/2110_a2448_1266~~gnl/Dysnectes_brevis/2110_a2448_1266.p1  ORF type:complete len:568 (-),score=179.56 gnl/Dysnectes_brevis/2110_a2448_1266:90-1793(-)
MEPDTTKHLEQQSSSTSDIHKVTITPEEPQVEGSASSEAFDVVLGDDELKSDEKSAFFSNTPGTFSPVSVIKLLLLNTVLVTADTCATNISLKAISESFEVDISTVQWVLTIYYIANASSGVIMGRMGDRGPVRVLQWGLIGSIGAYAFIVVSRTFSALLYARAILGVGHAACMANNNTLLRTLPRADTVSHTIALSVAVTAMGAVVAPTLGGFIADQVGWRATYILLALLCLVQVAILRRVPEPYQRVSKGFDWLGATVLALAVGSLCLGFTYMADQMWVRFFVLLGVAVLLCWLFIAVERRVPAPIIPLGLLQTPLVELTITNGLYNMSLNSAYMLLPFVYSVRYGLTAMQAGMLDLISPFAILVSSIVATRRLKKEVSRKVATGGLLLAGLAYLLMSMVLNNGVVYVVTTVAIVCLGMGQILCSIQPAIMMCAPEKYLGAVAGFPLVSRTIGSSVGIALVSSVHTLVLGVLYPGPPDETDPDYAFAFVRAAQVSVMLPAVLIIAGALLLHNRVGNNPSEEGKKGFRPDQIQQITVKSVELKSKWASLPHREMDGQRVDEEDVDV